MGHLLGLQLRKLVPEKKVAGRRVGFGYQRNGSFSGKASHLEGVFLHTAKPGVSL